MSNGLTFGTVCSGIGAPEQAVAGLGWRCSWQAEVDPQACRVLAARWGASRPERMPDHDDPGLAAKARLARSAAIKAIARITWPESPLVRNLGDMTTIAARVLAGEVEAPDVLIGGTPCQDFSIAGLRAGIAGDRGKLTLEFVRIADAIDAVRRADGRCPCIILWENVPGILSHGNNPFGAFLAGLVGCQSAIPRPQGSGWTDAGVVDGPSRRAAWRILDAQHFGLAQRRERVFVLARGGAGDWICADALLPIAESLRWHSAPSREAGEKVAAAVGASLGGSDENNAADCRLIAAYRTTGNAGCYETGDVISALCTGTDRTASVLAYGGNNTAGEITVATALNAHGGPCGRMDFESETFITHTLRGEGFDASEDGTGRGVPIVPVSAVVRRLTPRECHRLQGFPDDHCALLGMADGPQYRMIGNSMAVPVVRWISRRIERVKADA